MPLVVIPTPIGNLGDVTLRALDELRSAGLVLCEDTRHSGPILEKWGVTAPRMSYQKFNERARVDEVLRRLADGQKIALISDAGTPGISDPGAVVIRAAIENGFPVDVLPGATAFVPALLLSGLEPQPFVFVGFLPDKEGERDEVLNRWRNVGVTTVFYLSPHKAFRHLSDMARLWGPRRAALAREISKIHQEVRRGDLQALAESVADGVKGELVLVVEGVLPEPDARDWQEEALALRQNGLSVKEISARLASGAVTKNEIKEWLIAVERDGE